MKQIKILYNDVLNDIELEAASELMDGFGHRDLVENLNWKETYPYRPITLFNIARSNDSIFIKYSVRGSMLRAIYSNDLEPVNEDSCVEFFCKLPDSDNYMNFEFNCIGTCNASKRKSKTEGVVRYTLDELAQIKRYPSIGRRAFNEMEGMFEWELTVKIPFTLMGIDPNNLPEKMMGNFYKCADGTDSPHYVSWSPIKTEKPNFHCPEFFGELIFK
ncbi:MAG TPA: carbohydrate-binding family 9-like protein [Paludibacter sp.]|nr:carbohydrate-binding family 9-like protein [Paludibacter sp.]